MTTFLSQTVKRSVSASCPNMYDNLLLATVWNGGLPNAATMSAASLVGATTIKVSTTDYVAAGDLYYVDAGSDNFEIAIVSAVGTLDGVPAVTLDRALARAHSSTARVGDMWQDLTHVYGFNNGTYGRYMSNQITTDPGPLVCVNGDSWGAGGSAHDFLEFKLSMEAKFLGTRILNFAQPGENLNEQVARYDAEIAPLNPSLVVNMAAFVNDIYDGRTEAQMKADIDSLWEKVGRSRANLLMSGIAPLSAYPTETAALAPILRAYINALPAWSA